MKLAFVFIEKFNIINQKLFSFNNEYLFEITSLKQEGQYALNVKINPEYVNVFPSHILNITGLVGKNGSGKSTVLNCIKLLFGQLQLLTIPLIFGLIDDQKNTLNIYYYAGGGDRMLALDVSAINSTGSSINIPAPIGYKVDRLWNAPKVSGISMQNLDLACCYYSSAFDSNREVIYENILNISVNYKVEEFLKDYIKTEVNDAVEKERELQNNKKSKHQKILSIWPSHIADFHNHELIKKIKFIAYTGTRNTEELPPLPESLTLRFRFDDFKHF